MNTSFPLSPTIGTLKEDKIIGRDKEINNILKSLKVQSITVEEIRRMGKTLLLRKLEYKCNNGLIPEFEKENFRAIYFSLQGQKNLGEVIDLLINKLKDSKEWSIDFRKVYDFARQLIGGVSVGAIGTDISIKLPELKQSWKEIFFKTLDQVATTIETRNQKLIIILDELPIMLWDWYKAKRHDEAIELLDILRERRQELERKGLRFIYCGSIGIKIILQTLREEFSYTGEPTNDMVEYNVKPFEQEESIFLMECYIQSGFEIDENLKTELLIKIHALSNGLPFYIANMFIIIQNEFENRITRESIDGAYDMILNDPKYQKAFNQLKERLDTYYSQRSNLMSQILSVLSKAEREIDEEDLISQINEEEQNTKQILYTLVEDHYLLRSIKEGKRKYSFKYKIFKEWWKINIA